MADFLAILPTVQRVAKWYFRFNRDREECIANTVAYAFVRYKRLAERGIDPKGRFAGTLAYHSAQHVLAGASVGNRQNNSELLSPVGRALHGYAVYGLEVIPAYDTQTPIPDQVCLRLDYGQWLRTLPARERRMIGYLGKGYSLASVSKRFRVGRFTMTLNRRRWWQSWEAYQAS